MNQLLLMLQILSALLVIVAILIQSKGTGFSRSFKSQASFTRRGLEKIVFKATFVFAGFFIIISIIQLVV
jgi:protein translocase SecG subunit